MGADLRVSPFFYKKKIIDNGNISFETMYLFCSYKERLNAYMIFDILTQGGKLELTNILQSEIIINSISSWKVMPLEKN